MWGSVCEDAFFHGDDGDDYWSMVRREGGTWKVTSIVPQPFYGGGAG
jgi:hypothetical protein